MALFRRRPAAPHEPDPALPFLDVDAGARLRAMVRTVLAEHGVETALHDDRLEDLDGREFGLWNVAAACHAEGSERRWRPVVEDHVRRVLAATAGPDPLDDLTPEQLARQVYVRLYDAEALGDRGGYGYARELVPGVVELLAVDFPETVALLRDDTVARLGGVDRLREAGTANLRTVVDLEHHRLDSRDGARLDVLTGESVFTASQALLLPELLQRTFGTADAPDGVLVAMPFRHQLVLHVVADASVVPSIGAMARLAVHGYSDAPGALTPWVYWWRDGSWDQVTHPADDGIAVVPPPALQDVVERLLG